jgi:hypothetical protein
MLHVRSVNEVTKNYTGRSLKRIRLLLAVQTVSTIFLQSSWWQKKKYAKKH